MLWFKKKTRYHAIEGSMEETLSLIWMRLKEIEAGIYRIETTQEKQIGWVNGILRGLIKKKKKRKKVKRIVRSSKK